MSISLFSFVTSALFSTVFILALHFMCARRFFLQSLGVRTALALYGLSLFRMIFAVEMPFAAHIGLGDVYNSFCAFVRGTLIKVGCIQVGMTEMLCGIWFTVAGILILRFLWGNHNVNRELALYARKRFPAAERVLKRIRLESRYPFEIEVHICPEIDVPMGVGFIRKRIYLPDEEYTDSELYYILKHEYTHFHNRDLLIKLVIRVLCCVFWWNPAVYLLKKDIGHMLEIRCDMKATEGFSKRERAEYLMTIIRILKNGELSERTSPAQLSTELCPNRSRKDIKERFLLITSPAETVPVWFRAVFWGLAAAALALSYSFVFQPVQDPASGGGAAIPVHDAVELTEWINLGVLWVFVLIQMKYQMFRNKGRSILALAVAALLCGAMAFYSGNVQSTQKAIDTLAGVIPVNVNVVNRDGSRRTELFIDPQMLDDLSASGVKDVFATAEAVGAWSDSAKSQEFFFGGDVTMAAVNHLRAWENVEEDKLEWQDGTDASILETDQPVCVLTEKCAGRFGVGLGDEVSVAVYAVRRNSSGVTYEQIEDAAFRVAGIYHNGDSAIDKEMHITTGWMRAAAGRKGTFFSYDSAVCQLSDPRKLNEFKGELPKMGFMPPFEGAANLFRGDAIAVDDELFIKTGQNLRRNLETFQRFLIPFYLLVIGLVTLTTFLMLRNSRREMAIASSLGQPKWQTALANFASTVTAYLAGCALMVPGVVLLAGISALEGLAICGVFMLCAAAGVALALAMLLRFDTLALLTKTD